MWLMRKQEISKCFSLKWKEKKWTKWEKNGSSNGKKEPNSKRKLLINILDLQIVKGLKQKADEIHEIKEINEIITKEINTNIDNKTDTTTGMTAETDKTITEKKTTKIKKTINPPLETNVKEVEIEREAMTTTNRAINLKSILRKTEMAIEDNIEVKKTLKNLGNKKFLLIVKMMITLITQMKKKDM